VEQFIYASTTVLSEEKRSRETDLIGSGPVFPLDVTTSGRMFTATGATTLRASIYTIINVRMGERYNRPTFGCRLANLMFEPNDIVLKSLAELYIQESLVAWEPRIDILNIDIIQDEETVWIVVWFKERLASKVGNTVIPFNRYQI
jgi:phage baseplate assembly protein W